MPTNYFVQRALERPDVELTYQPQPGGQVVGCAVRVDLREQPQTLLRIRERQLLCSRDRRDGRQLYGLGRSCHGINAGRELFDCGCLQDLAQWQVDAQRLTQPNRNAVRHEGVTTQLEETIMHTDAR